MLLDCYGNTQSAKKKKQKEKKRASTDAERNLQSCCCWFLQRNWLSPLGQSVAHREDLPPSPPAAALPAVFEPQPCQWTVPSWLQGITLNKDILYALTCCLEKQWMCFQAPWAPKITASGLKKWITGFGEEHEQLLRITMLRKQPAKTDFIIKPKTMHICLLQHKAKFWVKTVIYV